MTPTDEVTTTPEMDALEFAWGIICNAGEGDWKRESADWQDAAARFRTEYFSLLDKHLASRRATPTGERPA